MAETLPPYFRINPDVAMEDLDAPVTTEGFAQGRHGHSGVAAGVMPDRPVGPGRKREHRMLHRPQIALGGGIEKIADKKVLGRGHESACRSRRSLPAWGIPLRGFSDTLELSTALCKRPATGDQSRSNGGSESHDRGIRVAMVF